MRAPLAKARKLSILRAMPAMADAECGGAICSWCARWLGLRPKLLTGAITDSICEDCQRQQLDFSTDGDFKSSLSEVGPQQRQAIAGTTSVSSEPSCPSDTGAMPGRPSEPFESERYFVGAMQEVPA